MLSSKESFSDSFPDTHFMPTFSPAPHDRLRAIASRWIVLATLLLASSAHALPPGREWRSALRTSPSGVHRIVAIALARDTAHAPVMAALAACDSCADFQRRWWTLGWQDSNWVPVRAEGGASSMGIARFVSGTRSPQLLWIERNADDPMRSPILATSTRTGVVGADTLARTSDQSSGLDAASSPGHFWLARSQQLDPRTPGFVVRVRHRDARGRWIELPTLGSDEYGCAISAQADGGGLCVTAGRSGLAWARGSAAGWRDHGTLVTTPWSAQNPRMMSRAGGGAWLAWTAGTHAWIAAFDGTRWLAPESLSCSHVDGGRYLGAWCALAPSADDSPVVAWSDRGESNGRDVICVAVPDERGRWQTEEVPGSEGTSQPALAVDAYGETWVAGVRDRSTDAWVAHTRVTAIAESIGVVFRGAKARVRCRLSSEAPGSHWTVLCSRDGVHWAPASRMTADTSRILVMECAAPPPGGETRYRIRRDAVDVRDVWLSDPVTATPR